MKDVVLLALKQLPLAIGTVFLGIAVLQGLAPWWSLLGVPGFHAVELLRGFRGLDNSDRAVVVVKP
jgi:hypothetical protein